MHCDIKYYFIFAVRTLCRSTYFMLQDIFCSQDTGHTLCYRTAAKTYVQDLLYVKDCGMKYVLQHKIGPAE